MKSRLSKKTNAKRNTKAGRAKMPKAKFGDPTNKKFRIDDKAHAANAKARATQMVKKGKLSAAKAATIKARANRVLKRKGR